MGYITLEYYQNDYKGVEFKDTVALERFIERASDVVDQLTNYIMVNQDFERLAQLIQDQVKKATAAQVEFYVLHNGDEEINAGMKDAGNIRIGSFSYEGSSTGNLQKDRISPATLEYLKPTGMLYTGLGVVQNAFY